MEIVRGLFDGGMGFLAGVGLTVCMYRLHGYRILMPVEKKAAR